MFLATEIPDHVREEVNRRIEVANVAYESIRDRAESLLPPREEYVRHYVQINFPPLTWTGSTARVAPA